MTVEGIALRGFLPALAAILVMSGMSGAVEATGDNVTFRPGYT